jgi:hypothetical protein
MIIRFPELQRKKAPPDDAPTNTPIDQRTIDVPLGVRGLSREQSARYIGISASLFDQLVKVWANAKAKEDQCPDGLGS